MPVRGQPVSRFDGPVGWGPLVGLLGLLHVQGALMSKTQHTPGPWVIGGQSEAGRYISINGGGKVLARVMFSKPNDPFPSDDANARLIAAAPMLLEALQAAHDDIVSGALDPSDFPWLSKARAAIAKATGDA